MKVIKEGNVLQSKTRNGLAKYWQGLIYQDGSKFFIGSRHWHTKANGESSKVTDSIPYAVKPKNVGKANETTPAEQAESEFNSMIKKQMDKNYLPEGAVVSEDKLPLPMLAQKFKERKHEIKWPAYVQPKYNGMRMAFDGDFAQSRGGKPIISEVIQHLKCDIDGFILDGELILPNNPLLQESMKAIKKYREELSPKLLYIVYDIMDEEMTFEERIKTLEKLKKSFPKNVILSNTYSVKNEDEVNKHHREFTLAGYEGTIIRNADGMYAIGQRSNDLQKYKDFVDAEFKIIDVIESGESGQYEGCAKFVCITKQGKEFHCNPEGTIEYKKELYRDRKKYVGQWLTIRYNELTKDKIPAPNPVGVSIREEGEF